MTNSRANTIAKILRQLLEKPVSCRLTWQILHLRKVTVPRSSVVGRVDSPASVVIVGASAAGLTTAESLRRRGFGGRLVLVGDEDHLPYDRPPLSKQVLSGDWPSDRAQLRTPEQLTSLGIELLLGQPATALDPTSGTVTTTGGDLHGDVVVIATGARPRGLLGQQGMPGVHGIRSLDDAIALRADLKTAEQVVVVGDGVLGAEAAATTRRLGHDVTLVGPQRILMGSQLGRTVGGLLTDLHGEHGARMRLGCSVAGLVDYAGRCRGVELVGGEQIPADVVIVALGATPATDWLEASGLTIDNGVVCNSRCEAAEAVYAVGDVARWHHDQLGRPVRLENRTNATEQARAVADNILGADRPYVPVPYFWTDQYAAKIQVHGFVPQEVEITVAEGDLSDRRFVAHAIQNGRGVGVVGWNMPKQTRLHRIRVLEGVGSAA